MIPNVTDIVYDTNYTAYIPNGGFPLFSIHTPQTENNRTDTNSNPPSDNVSTVSTGQKNNNDKKKKGGFFDNLLGSLFPSAKPKKDEKKNTKHTDTNNQEENPLLKDKDLRQQIKTILEMPDEEYSDKKLTSKLRQYITEVERHYSSVVNDYKSHISPSYREFTGNHFNVSGLLGKTYYTHSYPSYIDALRTRDLLSFHSKWDMSFFIFPEDDAAIQSMLKQKATQLKAEIKDAAQKGVTLDTEIEQQYKDVDMIRQKLTTREERYFETGYYINLYEETEDKLKETGKKFEQKIGGYGIRLKNATQRMDEGFSASLPICSDELGIVRSTVTSSLAGSFPFIANDLVSETGILYGVNQHTGGLVIFDRFNSNLPNMNSVILATSGAGKSFTVKLEIIRYLLNGIDSIVIDPENEYKGLAEQLGGTYINIATSSQQYLNPFDLPPKIEDVDYGKGDLLRSQIMSLIGLIELLIGNLSPEEEALLDKALQNTYSLKGFSMDDDNFEGKQPPLMEDLMNVLEGMDGGDKLALRLSKFVSGTFGKVFNNYTNVDINNKLTVFSIRDLEEALKTPAMFNVLNFIWTKVRSQKKKRLLVADEAWIMLQHETSANFLFGLTKRARKYGLGITTISQDIEDFVKSKYGKPIISNSALQLLLKQSTTSIKSLNSLLSLSQAEQQRLVSASIGEGLLFAGPQHIGLKILASPKEKGFITTDVK